MRSHVREAYERAGDEHWWFQGRRRILAGLLEGWQPPIAGRILDVGPGYGVNTAVLARHGPVTAVDLDPVSLAACVARGAHDTVLADATDPPFGDATFDLVAGLDVLEHLDDDAGALGEWHRILHDDGRLLVTVPAFPCLWGRQDVLAEHRRRYGKRQLRNLLEGNGFRVERLSFFNTLLFPPIAMARLAMRPFLDDAPGRSDLDVPAPFGLNGGLARLFGCEAHVLRRVNLPIGVSLVALARRA